MKLLKKFDFSLVLFLLSVAFFAAVFYLERHFMTNFDENDHLAADFFMKNGRLIYKDFFSHHFPLPYYWSYLFTPFWSSSLPSRTIAFFRFSALSMYLLNFFLVFLSFKNRLSRFSFSLWIILLATFFSLYHGNLILSETFAAIFISSLFWLTVPVILKWEKIDRFRPILLIVLASAAFWTQPLLIFLFLIPLLLSPQNWRKIILFSFLLNLIPLIVFFFTGQLSYFWQQGIVFNFLVYPKFFVDDLPPGNKTVQTIVYFFQNEFYLFTHFRDKIQIFQNILHLSFWLLAYKIFKSKNRFFLIPLFLLFLASRIREVKIIPGALFNFGIYPFLVIASASFVVVLFLYLKNIKFLAVILFLTLIFISFWNSQEVIRQSLRPGYNYEVFWSYRQRTAEIIDKLTNPNEKILIYPHDVDYYALSSRLPPDRFVYWFPWINSVPQYRQERLMALKNVDIPVIYVGSLAFKGDPDFYAQYFPNLTANYLPVLQDGKPTGIWLKKIYSDRLKSL